MPTLTEPAMQAPTMINRGDADRLTVHAWHTPIDHIGHDHRSPYAERFWLPIIGPTCLFLLRCLAYGYDTNPDTLILSRSALGVQLGLNRDNGGTGKHSPLSRAFQRLETFRLATQLAPNVVSVRAAMPWLDAGQVTHLADAHRDEHAAWVTAFNTNHPDHAELRGNAAQVAVMRRKNATPELIVASLTAWNVDPATITDLLAS